MRINWFLGKNLLEYSVFPKIPKFYFSHPFNEEFIEYNFWIEWWKHYFQVSFWGKVKDD